MSTTLARGIALFISTFLLVNLLLRGNHWWFDFRPLPKLAGDLVMFVGGLSLLAWSIRPAMRAWRRRFTLGAVGTLGLTALCNVLTFYLLVTRGSVATWLPFPLSLLTACAMLLILLAVWKRWCDPIMPRRVPLLMATVAACAIAAPLLQMICFGNTDYRRRADVAVVFGARAYSDGRASDALSDRVRAACQLYHQHLVSQLIFSGGPGDGAVHETESMRSLALELGVPEHAILLDPGGLNTAATVSNSLRMIRELGAPRVLVVSHFYHLPRIKLEFERAGVEVFTVPAPQGRPLNKLPLLIAREVAAIWFYYLAIA